MDVGTGRARGRDDRQIRIDHEHIANGCACIDGIRENARSFDQEATLALTELATRQSPRCRNGWIPKARNARQDALSSDCFATSASAANASGSLTASSASILRSTSTSANRKPDIKRL